MLNDAFVNTSPPVRQIKGFKVSREAIKHLPSELHRAIAWQLVMEGTWTFQLDEEVDT